MLFQVLLGWNQSWASQVESKFRFHKKLKNRIFDSNWNVFYWHILLPLTMLFREIISLIMSTEFASLISWIVTVNDQNFKTMKFEQYLNLYFNFSHHHILRVYSTVFQGMQRNSRCKNDVVESCFLKNIILMKFIEIVAFQ